MKQYPYYDAENIKDLKELINFAATEYKTKTAFEFERDEKKVAVDFIKLKNDVDALGTYFYSIGLKNAKISLYAENSYEWIVTYFAAVNGSNIIVPIDKELSADEVKNLVLDSDSKAVVYSDAKELNVNLFKKDIPDIKYIKISGFDDAVKQGQKIITSGNKEFIENKIDVEKNCAIIYTSGTTGKPKGVMLSHKNLASDAVNSSRNLFVPADTVLVLPLNHTFGFMAGILCQVLRGYRVYINQSLKTILKDIQYAKPGHVSLVPLFVETFYKSIWRKAEKQGKADALRKLIKVSRALLKVGIDLRKVFFKSIREAFGGEIQMIISGGAPIEDKYMQGFEDFGIRIINGYGITEGSPIVSTSRNKWLKYGSVGLPVPNCEAKILDPNEDGEGEILIKGDNVMMGYYKNEQATKEAFDGEWFKTGDFGKIDEDGFIYITGRKKNIIILSNGKNVYPEEIEAVILSLDEVNEVLVYSDEKGIVAEVYTEQPEIKEEIKKKIFELNNQLASYKRVQIVKFREMEFEKTSTKKIKRFVR